MTCSNFPKIIIWLSLLIVYRFIIRYENKTERWRGKKITPRTEYYIYDTLLSSLDCSESLSPPKDRPKGSADLQTIAFSKLGFVMPIGFYTSVFIFRYGKGSEFIPDEV